MIEYHPGVYKFLVLEGTGRLYRPGHLGDSVLVRPGQMVFGNPDAAVSDPVDVDIDRFIKTSRLITDFPPLHSEKSIMAEGQKQLREKSKKTLIGTNLVIFGGGTTSVAHRPRADRHGASHNCGADHAAPSAKPESGSGPRLPVTTEYEKMFCENFLGRTDRLLVGLLVFRWPSTAGNRCTTTTSARITGNSGRAVGGSSYRTPSCGGER